ncbi:MAG: hypothetical protein MUF27_14065 [Acidobacteria bacterium]|nr:hypothetical protein [Acidobacteriota bacterium]
MRARLPLVLALLVVATLAPGSRTPAVAAPSAPAAPAAPAPPGPGWLALDYRPLVDLRQPTHSGEPVGMVLERLGGRPRPGGTVPADAADAADHSLVDPLLEPFAFVMADAVEAAAGAGAPGFLEIGSLFPPGAPEPAWAELVRARRYLLESDGRGTLRAFVPWAAGEKGGDGARLPAADEVEAAKAAWAEAWPVLRHALAAERRRTGKPLAVEVRAYAHFPARTRFLLGARPHRVTVDATGPDGRRAPLDLAAWQRFLDQGLTLEGARLDPDGGIVLFGSPAAAKPSILGRPVSLADAAVAYRAVFHGGAAEPYMSLDRGFAPQTALVNYGGRLQDTGLGMVSLLCDARFKTFSQGIDIVEGADVRARVRATVPGFRTHLERFAGDAGSKGLSGQQTRLWFYPDTVELTLSAEGDLLAMRRARMAAASEKVQVGTGEGIAPAAPWTKATVDEINRDYDALARLFPEMADLDQAVRWLSLFTWLRAADRAGLPVPELDALLAIELPAAPTPRRFPQLLAFNAVPETPGPGAVDVFERVDVGAALDRLAPPGGRPLPAAERFRRALAALDRRDPQQAALAAELAELNATAATDTELDAAAFRAERLRMHQLVLGTLPAADRTKLRARAQAGDPPRVFSVGIGGLDLGMGSSLARAAGRSGGLTGLGATARAATGSGAGAPPSSIAGAATASAATSDAPREAWRQDPAGLPAATLPAHAPAAGEAVAWPAAVDARYRRASRDAAGGALVVSRVENGRALRYRVEPGGAIAPLPFEAATPAAVPQATAAAAALPDDLMLLQRVGEATTAAGVPAVVLRLSAAGGRQLEAPFPRAVLQRLVLGHEADLTPDKPLPGFSQLPPALAALARTMVMLRPEETKPPWVSGAPSYPGEESAAVLARALSAWWAGTGRTAVAGVDAVASPPRWQAAPRPRPGAVLLLPGDAFPAPYAALAPALREAWKNGPVVPVLLAPAGASGGAPPELVVLASAEGAAPLAARALALANDPAMKGKLLAVLSLASPLRVDLATRLLESGNLAGVGLADWGGVSLPGAVRSLGALDAALAAPAGAGAAPKRIEDLPGPFAWTF